MFEVLRFTTRWVLTIIPHESSAVQLEVGMSWKVAEHVIVGRLHHDGDCAVQCSAVMCQRVEGKGRKCGWLLLPPAASCCLCCTTEQ